MHSLRFWILCGLICYCRGVSLDAEEVEFSPDIVVQSEEENLQEREESLCYFDSQSMQMGARHSQGAGIGYGRGYTTIEGFFSFRREDQTLIPFVDLRGHLFNNRTFAANAGVGFRSLRSRGFWGINAYYDYRNTREFNYNQIGLGLEAIGSAGGFTVNGYWPVGRKLSHFFDPGLVGDASGPTFAFFQGNQLFIQLSGTQGLAAAQEFALKGIDAKVSWRALKKGFFSLDLGIGPYYFQGARQTFAAGGKANATARFSDYAMLSVTGSYDNLFHQRVQGEIGFSIPFGPKNRTKTSPTSGSCEKASFASSQLTRGADRFEIIVLDTQRTLLASALEGDIEVAINPQTGLPYFIWFVNNTSMSDGTFESPFPLLQTALMMSSPEDIFYVYRGNGSAYDTFVPLQEGQMLLGAGVAQTINTVQGVIVIPIQEAGLPVLENMAGGPMIALANRNTVSGFNLHVLDGGDTVSSGAGVDSFSFLNNVLNTTNPAAMRNLSLSSCFGAILIGNNQFTMASGDTGSTGVFVQNTGGEVSTLSIFNNQFSNHASRAISLDYQGTSSSLVEIVNGNVFSPPMGAPGTNAIAISTSGMATLTGSISNQNVFTDYTGDVIGLNWNGTGPQMMIVAGNQISSDPTVTNTRGVAFSISSPMGSLTVSGNQFSHQGNVGIDCSLSTNAELSLAITGNSIAGEETTAGGVGIRINTSNMTVLTGSITGNLSTGHLQTDFAGSCGDSSSQSLTIANNILTCPSVFGGSFPNGMSWVANGTSSSFHLDIQSNQIHNHPTQGINLSVSDTATAEATINGNVVTVPDSLTNTAAIVVSASNSSAVTSTYTVTNNFCSGHTNTAIECFPNNASIIDLTITGNYLTGPTVTPMGSNPQGIAVSASNTAIVTALIHGQNQCIGYSNHGIVFGSSDNGMITAIIDNNTIISPTSGTPTNGITIGPNNSSAGPLQSYTITNNTCANQSNGSIQCFPSGSSRVELVISNNALSSVTDGITMANPVGIQFDASGDSTIVSATISGNTWTGPSTYQASTFPSGIQVGIRNNVVAPDITITGNAILFPITTYADNTGTNGIQLDLRDFASATTATITNNSISYLFSTYIDKTNLNGISLGANDNRTLTDTTIISNNAIAYAPLMNPSIMDFSTNGISVGGASNAFVGTALAPVLVQQNAITGLEGTGIIAFSGSVNPVCVDILSNALALGGVTQGGIGILTVPQSTGKLVVNINDNVVEGNNGGLIGIVATNQGNGCQDVSIQRNSVSNVRATMAPIPVAGLGGGIGAAIVGAMGPAIGDLNAFINDNGVSGNLPQGIFGLDAYATASTGNLCFTITNNHGVGAQAPDDYTLLNPPPMTPPFPPGMSGPPSSFIYNSMGNAGTLNFSPSMADFMMGTGSCMACPP